MLPELRSHVPSKLKNFIHIEPLPVDVGLISFGSRLSPVYICLSYAPTSVFVHKKDEIFVIGCQERVSKEDLKKMLLDIQKVLMPMKKPETGAYLIVTLDDDGKRMVFFVGQEGVLPLLETLRGNIYEKYKALDLNLELLKEKISPFVLTPIKQP
jgi:hypothetical protein